MSALSNKLKKIIPIILLFVLMLFVVSPVKAQLDTALKESGLESTQSVESGDLTGLTIKIVRAALGLIGILFVLLIIYAGYLWITSAGENDKTEKAKKIIKAGIVGIIIVLCAYIIASFVIRSIGSAVNTRTNQTSADTDTKTD